MDQSRPRFLRCLATAWALSFASVSSAVTLSEFMPTAHNLTPECNYLYENTNIEGCSPADFTGGAPCSQACIQGLAQLYPLVISDCGGNALNEQYIIAEFLNGQGIQKLCPEVTVTTIPQAATPSASSSSSGSGSASTGNGGGGVATVTSGVSTEPSPTQSPSGGLIVDTSSSPQPSSTATPSIKLTISSSCSTDSARATTSTFITSFKPTSLIIATSNPSSGLLQATSTPPSVSSSASCIENGATLFNTCSAGASVTLANSMAPLWAGIAATLCMSIPILFFA